MRGEGGGEAPGESRLSSAFLSGLERGLRWILRLAADIIDETMSRVDTSLPRIIQWFFWKKRNNIRSKDLNNTYRVYSSK